MFVCVWLVALVACMHVCLNLNWCRLRVSRASYRSSHAVLLHAILPPCEQCLFLKAKQEPEDDLADKPSAKRSPTQDLVGQYPLLPTLQLTNRPGFAKWSICEPELRFPCLAHIPIGTLEDH